MIDQEAESILNKGINQVSPHYNKDFSVESSAFLSNYDDKGESVYNKSENFSANKTSKQKMSKVSKYRGSIPGLANCASNLSISMASVSAQSFIVNKSNLAKK